LVVILPAASLVSAGSSMFLLVVILPAARIATSCLSCGSPSFTSTDEQSLHSDDVEDFWRTQDEWVVSGWRLYPKSSVHVLDLTHGKTMYMFVDKFYPIRAPLLERMLRHRLTVPPTYCWDVVVAGSVIQTIQDGLRESYECLSSAPM
ncbi:hypothetical protein Tco_1350866, partial [Tanacetum coccineum]